MLDVCKSWIEDELVKRIVEEIIVKERKEYEERVSGFVYFRLNVWIVICYNSFIMRVFFNKEMIILLENIYFVRFI